MKPELKQILQIHSYKHDKQIHRVWNNITTLKSFEHELVIGNYRTKVIESNGRYWNTREPAICFFYDDYWFNVIAMLKDDGIYYYCNISSPYIFDDEAIKYIDYDLDVRIDPSFKYRVLDREEYKRHAIKMEYSEELKSILENSLSELIKKIENREPPFNHDVIKQYFDLYCKINKKIKCKSFD